MWTNTTPTCSNLNSKTTLCLNICPISTKWTKILILYHSNKYKIIWTTVHKNKEDKGSTNFFITVNINHLSHKWWAKMVIRHTIMIFKILNQSKKDLKNLRNKSNKIRSLTNGKVITKMVCILIISKNFDFDPLINL